MSARVCGMPAAAKCQKRIARLLDHLVGCGEQRLRNGQAERFCALKIDNQFILGRRLHRKIAWLFALKDAIDVSRCSPKGLDPIGP